jgi:hypothetical protein
MSQQDLLKLVVGALEESGCRYMVTGSYASSLQGEPRLTHDIDLVVSAPEDTILVKLRWAKVSGGSEKQYQDALRIYELQNEALDIGYIGKWVKKLGVEKDCERIVQEADL